MVNYDFFNSLASENSVERWGSVGYLDGVADNEKKYLADLYDGLADNVISSGNTLFDYEGIKDNLSFNILGARYFGCGDIYEDDDIKVFVKMVSFKVLRRVYDINKTFSINEFIEAFNNVKVNNSFLNSALNNKEKVNGEESYSSYLVEKIIDFLKK